MGVKAHLHASGEDGLAVGGGDGARVCHVRADQRHTTTHIGRGSWRGDFGTGLDGDVANAIAGRVWQGWWRVGRCRAFAAGGLGIGREQKLGVWVVEQSAGDQVVIDGECGGDERAGVHLA